MLSPEWGHEGICYQCQQSNPNSKAKLADPVDITGNDIYVQLFERFFPIQFIQDVILPSSNKKLKQQLTYGELQWLGLWILMSTRDGSDRCSFWSSKKIDMFDGSGFHLTELMSRNHFKAILRALSYVDHDPPVLLDHFWEFQQLIDAWNQNMAENFLPSWINVIDESMSKWVNEYTCPGFMFVPRKPWPFGNKFHDAGCADSDIIWQVKLSEWSLASAHL